MAFGLKAEFHFCFAFLTEFTRSSLKRRREEKVSFWAFIGLKTIFAIWYWNWNGWIVFLLLVGWSMSKLKTACFYGIRDLMDIRKSVNRVLAINFFLVKQTHWISQKMSSIPRENYIQVLLIIVHFISGIFTVSDIKYLFLTENNKPLIRTLSEQWNNRPKNA